MVLPQINTNPRMNTLKNRENKEKHENLSFTDIMKKKSPERVIITLAQIDEKTKSKKTLKLKTLNENSVNLINHNKTLGGTNNKIKNNDISIQIQSSNNNPSLKLVQEKNAKSLEKSILKTPNVVLEKPKRVFNNTVSPLKIIKIEPATEDENDRIAKVRKLYKEKKLHNFDKTKNFFVRISLMNSML